MKPRGSFTLELIRKAVHILVGVAIILLYNAKVLTLGTFGLIILLYVALMFYNLKAEKEFITRIIAINRADREIPGLDVLSYFFGCWIVLAVFSQPIAFAAIMVLAFADPIAHIVSRSFGATQTVMTRTTYLEGTAAGIVAGTIAASLHVHFLAAFGASCVAMLIEAGELRIGSHHIDDNLTIPISAALTLWVISLAFTIV
jgi:dolichol kinase